MMLGNERGKKQDKEMRVFREGLLEDSESREEGSYVESAGRTFLPVGSMCKGPEIENNLAS